MIRVIHVVIAGPILGHIARVVLVAEFLSEEMMEGGHQGNSSNMFVPKV